MKKKLLGILIALLTATLFSSCTILASRIDLELHLKEGKSYNINTIANQKISQTIGRQKENITQKIGLGYTFNVKKIEADGTAFIDVTFNSILLNQDGTTGKIQYDSSNPPNDIPPAAATYAALLGQSFSIIISPEGSIKNIQGMEKITKSIMKKLDLPESREESLNDKFGDKALKENMENLLGIYPDRPVRIGNSWTKRTTIAKGLPMILESKYTLKERSNGIALLEVRSEAKPSSAPIKKESVKFTYDISGTEKGYVKLEEATGWIVDGKISQQFSGQVKVEDDRLSRPLFFPISLEGTVDITSLKK